MEYGTHCATSTYMYVQIEIYKLKSECNVACIGSLGNFNASLGHNLSVLFLVPSCSSASTTPLLPLPSPLGGLNVKSCLFHWYCCAVISMMKESGTPTTLCRTIPCLQIFSSGLRHTHTLSLGAKFTLLVSATPPLVLI